MTTPSNPSRWLDTKTTCEYLNVSRSTLYSLIRAGLPAFRLSARALRFRSQDLDAFVQMRRV